MPRLQLNITKEVTKKVTINIKEPKVKFTSSGSTLLDLVLGGGWAEGRVANIVGDKSAGKTLLAIEACANFARLHSAEDIAYREAEAAFDLDYGHSMGLPVGIDFSEDVRTIEDFEADLSKWLETHKRPNLYIMDSLDALSSEAEMERDAGDASYGTEKAKALSQMFRKRTADMRASHCTLIIISQIRDNIGARFGETKKRSGGRALDFYASQIIWLHEKSKIKRTVTQVDHIVGVQVLAKNKKNKVGKPFREAGFPILFNYGIDDEQGMLDWLKENKGEHMLPENTTLNFYAKAYKDARAGRDRDGVTKVSKHLKASVKARWREIEDALEPSMSKYGD